MMVLYVSGQHIQKMWLQTELFKQQQLADILVIFPLLFAVCVQPVSAILRAPSVASVIRWEVSVIVNPM